jgi:predicted SprT family Zn-dependent metalloprotease
MSKETLAPSQEMPVFVGQALDRHGLAGEVLEGLRRLVSAEEAGNIFGRLSMWKFKVNSKVNNRYGLCDYGKTTLEVHAILLDKPTDLRQTFLHECAHAIDWIINGRSSRHGTEWRRVMSVGFLLPPDRCGAHTREAYNALIQMRVSKAKAKAKAKAMWACTGCDYEFAVMRRRRQPAEAHRCPHCKCPLRAIQNVL